MNEKQMQFRVGLLVIMAGVVAMGLAFRFGELAWLWEKHYTLGVHFDRAPGVERGTPVRKNGILIGSVKAVSFDESVGGVNVLLEIRERFKLRKDSLPMLSRSLLGDATLEFAPGKSRELLRPGDRLEGGPSADPMELIARMESKANETLESFAATSAEWGKVGKNLNNLADTHRGNLDQVIEEAAESLHQFTITMRSLNKTVADPEAQENLRTTLAALPQMMHDTQLAVQAFRSAAGKADVALGNLSDVTAPLAKRSNAIAIRLDHSMASLETLLAEMALFSKSMNSENGSLSLFAKDPRLYHETEQAAASLALMMKNLEPAIRDLRVFADKIARHPETIGVGGALKTSSVLSRRSVDLSPHSASLDTWSNNPYGPRPDEGNSVRRASDRRALARSSRNSAGSSCSGASAYVISRRSLIFVNAKLSVTNSSGKS